MAGPSPSAEPSATPAAPGDLDNKPTAPGDSDNKGGKTATVSTLANPARSDRFTQPLHPAVERLACSLDFDRRLAGQDIRGSQAHCQMLIACALIPKDSGQNILKGLEEISRELAQNRFVFHSEHEDIHMSIEARLAEKIGPDAGYLHTGRSRNDQVATDLRLWLREEIERLDHLLTPLMEALVDRAEEEAESLLPGYTHLQPAQPITFGHHLLAYVEMFERDRGRLADCQRRSNVCPLGSAALAGTSFAIDRTMTAQLLGFERPSRNSLDAVADRDFIVEFLAAAALIGVHLSRLAEELILWSSPGFAYVRLPDTCTTGSSIMPQKRNPDAAELVRGKTGRLFAALQTVLVLLKALPLSYNRDLQEDKPPLFDACDALCLCLPAMTAMIRSMTFDRTRARAACNQGYLSATDFADWLVQMARIPFRQAHHLAGDLVRAAESHKVGFHELPEAFIKTWAKEKGLTCQTVPMDATTLVQALRSFSPEATVANRNLEGGPAPESVRRQAAAARQRLSS